MLILILGIVLFLGAHSFATFREARAGAIQQYGEGAYKGAYSVVSVIGFILICWGFSRYRAEGWVQPTSDISIRGCVEGDPPAHELFETFASIAMPSTMHPVQFGPEITAS